MKNLLEDLKSKNIIKTQKVYNSMIQIDRGDFSPENPYEDSPQPIGFNATISAPHMHAFALSYLEPYCSENIHILDVGSGSGYLTAALSKMINDTGVVIGVEHIESLYEQSIKNISKHHANLIENKKVIMLNEDGRKGLKQYAPFKVIHVGAAAEDVPQDLIDQLDKNGRMFIPVGKYDQWIYLIDKDSEGKVTSTKLMPVFYVPLTDKQKQI